MTGCKKPAFALLCSVIAPLLLFGSSATRAGDGVPAVLPIRERAVLVNQITRMRCEQLLPRIMRETGYDMWLVICNEDNLDPIYKTLIPYESWCPITQILLLFDPGPDQGMEIERLSISRTNMLGLHEQVWDLKKEGQWECLARLVRERDPKKIGINESAIQWAADGLTVTLKRKLVEAIGPKHAARLESAEPLATLWLETLLDEELDLFARAAAVSRALISETFSNRVVTPGLTTTEDLRYHYWQRVADLGLEIAFTPSFRIRGRAPEVTARHGKGDKVIRPGDFLHCDVGLKYLRYNTDHQEVAYVLRRGEKDAPETLKSMLAEANRLQDVFCGEFEAGLTGNQLLANILGKAREKGIQKPKVYSHSLGYFLHEPGPLIGLPWEQVRNPGRGDVRLVHNSCFTAELSITMPMPEWKRKELRMPLEQDVAFTRQGVRFLAGRQKSFHLIE